MLLIATVGYNKNIFLIGFNASSLRNYCNLKPNYYDFLYVIKIEGVVIFILIDKI